MLLTPSRTAVRRTLAIGLLAVAPLGLASCGSKPSKEDVNSGFEKVLDKIGGSSLDASVKKKVASCITDKVYDKVSDTTLEHIAKGDKQVESKDTSTIDEAAKTCAEQNIKG